MAADQYVNATGVQAIRTWADGKFALDSDLDALEAEVQELITEGGEPNTIETISKNNVNVAPDANKNVNITVPTTVAELSDAGDYALAADVPADLSDLTNTGNDPYATEGYVDANGGKIDVIAVNNTDQTITSKRVNITVPTACSDLTNDSGFQTASDVSSAIASAVSSAYIYKGSVANQAALPSSGQTVGDVYDTQDTGMNYAWNGSSWDALGTYVDTSVLWTSTPGQSNSLTALTVAEINAILEPSS